MTQWRQLTRDGVSKMNEASLRQEVLLPLFKAMGFMGVREYHGAGERGKDIVMWKPDDLGHRLNYAVVVVAVKITGQVRGSSGAAGKVVFQVQQCFGSKFKDVSTLEDQSVHRCWVVTSKAMSPDAREAIAAALGSQIRTVSLIDGDELWRLVETWLKPSLLPQKLSEIHSILDEVSGSYNIGVNIGGSGVHLSIQPKFPNESAAEPVDFVFPPTREGQEAKDLLDAHVRTGEPVEIPCRFVGTGDISQLVRSVLGSEILEIYSVVLGPRGRGRAFYANAVIERNSGSEFVLGGVILRVAHAGTDEARLEGTRANLPGAFQIRLREAEFSLQISFDISNENVKQQLEIFSLVSALHEGGIFKINDVETGRTILGGAIPSGAWPKPSPLIHQVLEALYIVQERTGKLFSLPSSISAENAEWILQVAQILQTGALTVRGMHITLPVSRDLAERMLVEIGRPDQSFYVRSQEEQMIELLGTTIEMGRCETILPQALILEPDRQRLRRELDENIQNVFSVDVHSPGDCAAVIRYERWLNAEERGKYPGIQPICSDTQHGGC
jgi:hypothetical protein